MSANKSNHTDEERPTRVGCDPGLRTISTFVFENETWPNKYIRKENELLEKLKRDDPNSVIKQEFLNRQNKESLIKKDSNIRKFKVESGEYYDKIKINESNKHTIIEKKLAGIDKTEGSIPDNKTVDVSEYENYIKAVLKNVNKFRDFQFKSSNRKWRFTRYCAKSSFYDKLSLNFQNCRVGYGNLSGKFGNSRKGKRSVPIEDMKSNLRRRHVDLIDIDEYRTSKICHNCYSQKPSVISVLDAYDYKNHTKVFPDPSKTIGLTDKTPFSVTRGCYKCGTIINRDINAAQNMTILIDKRDPVFQKKETNDDD